MKRKKLPLRAVYGIAFGFLFLLEVGIALFVDDAFIRPYGGDILVTALLCCFLRVFFPCRVWLLPLWIFLFAAGIEVGQYFDFVTLLGLGESSFFRILLGSTFSAADILCYAVGCLLFALWEQRMRKHDADGSDVKP